MPKGPPPKPTKLKLIEGERKDRINKNEPQPEPKNIPCPDHICEEGKKYWEKEAPRLYRLGLLTEINSGPFELLCEAYGNWITYKEMVKEHGIAIRTPNGALLLSPVTIMANRSYDQYRRMCIEFGMTPSSISRIVVGKPSSKKKGIEEFID